VTGSGDLLEFFFFAVVPWRVLPPRRNSAAASRRWEAGPPFSGEGAELAHSGEWGMDQRCFLECGRDALAAIDRNKSWE
jgi:hypothetical protein